MVCTATILRYIYSMQFMWLLATLIIQPASPFGADVVCENHPEFPMTDMQVELCKKYPKLLSHLVTDAVKVFKRQLHHRFKHERWDGLDVNPPIFGSTDDFLSLQTKESAFVYALASAAVVHTVAEKCMQHEKQLPYCGCDKSLKNSDLPVGQKWSGCSPDMNFTLNFAKNFLDRRMDNDTLKHRTFVLHNNRIGRSIVQDYMHKTCTCTGASIGKQGCSRDRSCQMLLPEMDEISSRLREKYHQSVHARLLHHSGHLHPIVVDREDDNDRRVDSDRMIHFSRSPDYCTANPEYNIKGVAGRECTLNKNKTSSSHHCNNLCCDHSHETYTIREPSPCNCKFVWCCHVECETCYKTITKYRCKSKQ